MSQTTHLKRQRARMSTEDLEFLDRLIKLGLITEDQFVEITAAFRKHPRADVCELIVKGGYLKPRKRGWDRGTMRQIVADLWRKTVARA